MVPNSDPDSRRTYATMMLSHRHQVGEHLSITSFAERSADDKPLHLPHPTHVDPKQTWRRIMAAAIQRIAQAGYINVTMTAIADCAGVSRGARAPHIPPSRAAAAR